MKDFLSKLRPERRDAARLLKARTLHAGRDWLIGLFLFTLIVSSGSVVSGILFMRYSTISIGNATTEVAIPRYNEASIDEALAEYAQRRASYERSLTSVKASTSTPPVEVATTTVPVELPAPEPLPVASTSPTGGLDFE